MSAAVPLAIDEDSVLETIVEPIEPEDTYAVPDDDEEPDSGIYVFETPLLAINSNQRVSLSNLPYVEDHEGRLVPIVEPGYVALRIEPIGEPPIDANMHQEENTDQYTFRVPNPGREDDAAIFHGFTLEDEAQLIREQVSKLKMLEKLLTCMRTGYQNLLEEDDDLVAESFFGQVPTQPVGEGMIAIALGTGFD
ncbi:MAG TPA: hypothetical protein VHB51_01055 [Candidatus Saccharimonadales bacterium]|nr:hypothetical protein [Candidatus Saccharimonadales bacterium]